LNRSIETDKNRNISNTQCGISLPRNIEKEEESERGDNIIKGKKTENSREREREKGDREIREK